MLQFIPQEEGRIRVNSSLTGYVFDYYLKDQLGNTRMTITDDNATWPPIIDATSYYPFGLTMSGISSKAAGSLENKHKYNSIELDNDLDINTYEAFYRNLDPQTGRWWQIDPKIDEADESLSPYNSMSDDPILRSDPLGDLDDEGPGVGSVSWNFVKGVGQSLWGTVEGVSSAVMHPVETAKGIANAVSHPVETAKAIGNVVTETYNDFKNGNADVKANILGKITGEIAQVVVGTAEVKAGLNAVKELSVVSKGIQATKELARDSKLIGTGSKLFGNGIGKNLKGTLNTGEFRVGWGKHKGNDVFRVGIGNNPKFYPPTKILGKTVHKHIDIIKVKKTP